LEETENHEIFGQGGDQNTPSRKTDRRDMKRQRKNLVQPTKTVPTRTTVPGVKEREARRNEKKGLRT